MIRLATMKDIPRMSTLLRDFYEYGNFKSRGLNFYYEDIAKFMVLFINNQESIILVADEEGDLVGTVAGTASPWLTDINQWILEEHWWWVDPKYRGKRVTVELIKAFTDWGRERGASHVVMSSLDSDREKALAKYYARKGFDYLQTQYMRQL